VTSGEKKLPTADSIADFRLAIVNHQPSIANPSDEQSLDLYKQKLGSFARAQDDQLKFCLLIADG
jgi:hypothetical protein